MIIVDFWGQVGPPMKISCFLPSVRTYFSEVAYHDQKCLWMWILVYLERQLVFKPGAFSTLSRGWWLMLDVHAFSIHQIKAVGRTCKWRLSSTKLNPTTQKTKPIEKKRKWKKRKRRRSKNMNTPMIKPQNQPQNSHSNQVPK